MHANRQLLIDVDDLSVKRGGEPVIDGVSFCIHTGEFIGLIGPNGAGKTTLLQAILGLLPATSGQISRSTAHIAYVQQDAGRYNGIVPISVLEVVRLGAAGSAELARQALQTVGLAGLENRRFTELSGGQKQRVAIAKALAANADLLILDEPTTGIDEQTQADFYATLRTLQVKGIAIVLVAHEVENVLRQVNRLLYLNRTLLYDGDPSQFDAHKHMPAFYEQQHHAMHHERQKRA